MWQCVRCETNNENKDRICYVCGLQSGILESVKKRIDANLKLEQERNKRGKESSKNPEGAGVRTDKPLRPDPPLVPSGGKKISARLTPVTKKAPSILDDPTRSVSHSKKKSGSRAFSIILSIATTALLGILMLIVYVLNSGQDVLNSGQGF